MPVAVNKRPKAAQKVNYDHCIKNMMQYAIFLFEHNNAVNTPVCYCLVEETAAFCPECGNKDRTAESKEKRLDKARQVYAAQAENTKHYIQQQKTAHICQLVCKHCALKRLRLRKKCKTQIDHGHKYKSERDMYIKMFVPYNKIYHCKQYRDIKHPLIICSYHISYSFTRILPIYDKLLV